MRVANFTDTYVPQNNGVAKALYEVHKAKKAWKDEIFSPVGEGVERVGGIPVPTSPEYDFALSAGDIVRRAKGYDIIHVHTPYPMFYYGWKCARENLLPLVGSFHTDPSAFFGYYASTDSLPGRFASKVMWRYLMRLYNSCDSIIVPSEWTKGELEKRGVKRPVFVVPNGVDTERFSPKTDDGGFRKRFGIPKGRKVVLFVGRLEERKRPDIFVESAMMSKSDAAFVMAGEGKMKRALRKKAGRDVMFTGFLDDGILPQAFAAADIFVFPSEMETQGIVLLEAMASGCAVMSTEVGAAGELLDKEDMFKNPEELAGKIDTLLADGKRLEGLKRKNRRLVEKRYSMENTVKGLEEVYRNTLERFSGKKITVIVPTKNEINHIEKCLSSIKKQSYRNFEIIVADGNSTDGTEEVAKEYGRVVYCGKPGPGAGRNAGAKEAEGEILAFTDADTRVPEDWLEKIAYHFCIDPELAGLGGVLRPSDGGMMDEVLFRMNSDLFYRLTSSLGFQQLATPNCAYRKDEFMAAGGFDEEMSMFEDTDMSVRMSKRGKIKVDGNLEVYNSVRRMRQENYALMFLKYLKVYFNYIAGRPIKERHFDTILH